ncbi:MAG TPA: sigma factor-like helix-turn-helix DNA-binding protein [Acidimicrobiales bacterium]
MRDAEAKRARQARKRAKAIQDARRNGLSLEAIAERLGVSRERVRQMGARPVEK